MAWKPLSAERAGGTAEVGAAGTDAAGTGTVAAGTGAVAAERGLVMGKSGPLHSPSTARAASTTLLPAGPRSSNLQEIATAIEKAVKKCLSWQN